MICDACGQTVLLGEWPYCPHGHGSYASVGDECDIVQENGFAQPTRFRSKSALKKALDARGLEMRVQHVPIPGSDKSPFTTSWAGMDATTLQNAADLLDPARRTKTTTSTDQTPSGLTVTWQTRVIE